MALANLCSFSLQQSTFSLDGITAENPQTSMLHGLWRIQLWVWELWFRSISYCRTTVVLWAHQEAAECHLAVTKLEAGGDLVQRWGGGQVSFPSPHPVAQGGWWTESDAGTAQPCCLCFGEAIEKLLALVCSWKCARRWSKCIIVCTSSWKGVCLIRELQQQSPFLILLSTIQKDAVVLHMGSGKVRQTGKLWRAVIQRDSAG